MSPTSKVLDQVWCSSVNTRCSKNELTCIIKNYGLPLPWLILLIDINRVSLQQSPSYVHVFYFIYIILRGGLNNSEIRSHRPLLSSFGASKKIGPVITLLDLRTYWNNAFAIFKIVITYCALLLFSCTY